MRFLDKNKRLGGLAGLGLVAHVAWTPSKECDHPGTCLLATDWHLRCCAMLFAVRVTGNYR